MPWPLNQLCASRPSVFDVQIYDTVLAYNVRCADSVEDRVHQLLSTRLQGIYTLFG